MDGFRLAYRCFSAFLYDVLLPVLRMATGRARVIYLRISGLMGLGSESQNLSGLSLGLVFTRTYLMDNRFE